MQEAAQARTRSNGAGGALWAGIRAGQIVEELRDMHAVHVLRFEGLRPGTFGGWSPLDRAHQLPGGGLADSDSDGAVSAASGAGGRAESESGRLATAADVAEPGAWYPGIVEQFDAQFKAAIGDDAKWCCRCASLNPATF